MDRTGGQKDATDGGDSSGGVQVIRVDGCLAQERNLSEMEMKGSTGGPPNPASNPRPSE